ncbi:phage holin family protein [Mesorhizobium sp. M2D.F.Ca.ET.185.01.1.1]|uniref:phage holin family protein n=1 Tax=unclassified Mesorhizobium TaxID=325217 RepID=UPI000FCC38E1|nr:MULTISPECIES: phage holin family protein [unclassified Mesorhizobium]TGP83343.1 phage holin family protein [bacterium M00.F.Ca.ET.227.01.1.1]TGP99298.1 phage holin family protein [bacterium M00.F.Ca.ET.221.01.1.1]TGQ00028.1 phage holin family protein [bacterium M00.F.Ca.ET.222.01.1.1]TGT78475.1 phage holin family protein [bacterium M00.F.Ca.ET.159.01.1.1]TGT89141.1 phage holin family protein [bacterium M00.F.Ca.ET.157.01.1.1]TGU11414.1 phage holin family protein [bacterium M00.F.Ca.ET.163.
MGTLVSLISALVSGEAMAALQRARMTAILYGLAAIFALCGVGFLLGAAYIWVAARYGPLATSLGFGIGFLVIAGLIVVIHKLTTSMRSRRRARRRQVDMTALGITAALALLPALAKSKGGLGAVVAPALAVVAYAIYRENAKPNPPKPDPEDRT